MSYAHIIKEIGRGAEGSRDLERADAEWLYGAMLDGGVPDLELGAIVLALRMKGESDEEMGAFLTSANARVHALQNPSATLRPVVIPSYNGARRGSNLTPLLALLLRRYGVPVLVHGLLEGYGRITSGHIFRELGILPAGSHGQAQQALAADGLAFVPLPAIAPGLSSLLALRARMGVRNSAHSLVKMIDPFAGEGVILAAATHPPYLDTMRNIFCESRASALLLRATEGEPFANPKRCPRIEHLCDGRSEVLCEADHGSMKALPQLPDGADAADTAAWTQKVLDGRVPLPQPIARQLAACLYASGHAGDFNQARAIVAVEGGAG